MSKQRKSSVERVEALTPTDAQIFQTAPCNFGLGETIPPLRHGHFCDSRIWAMLDGEATQLAVSGKWGRQVPESGQQGAG